MLGGAIGGLVLALVTVFKKTWAPITAPLYAVVEGVFIGALSAIFEMRYPGIVMQAVGLTFGTMAAMLLAYRSGLIRATEKFKLGIVAATGGIVLLYLANFVDGLLRPLHRLHPRQRRRRHRLQRRRGGRSRRST